MRALTTLLQVAMLAGCSAQIARSSSEADSGTTDVALDAPASDTPVAVRDAGGDACPGGGQIRCGDECVDPLADTRHCGMCGHTCCRDHECREGRCVLVCNTTSQACLSPSTGCSFCLLPNDPNNCGQCGRVCAAGEACEAGRCVGGPVTAFEPCRSPEAYVPATTVRFGGAAGHTYEPRCVTVRAGSSIVWEGDFVGHPLAPSTRGTVMSPVPHTTSGTRAEVRFARAGFYPYYCTAHGTDSGAGMAGVVRVVD